MAEPPEDEQPLDDALAAAKPDEPPGLALARSRIGGALFGELAPGFGRFRVLERLGGGGMGVVYAAYDPQLDRGVALKTVHVPSHSRDVALREAKALAKLAHPNVVAVFDVGIEQDDIYIVMELVRGATLRAWVSDQPAEAVIDAYRQAGLALAAAHDRGLVHRDFKPDNAIVGDDGRVRVVDFGLAVESESAGGGAGTPAYMAPEQAAGAPVTPAADQFSFGVSLAEALPAPRRPWIDAIIERACAADPAARFTTMDDLVRALGRDPARIRRRRLVIAGLAIGATAATAGAFALGRSASPNEMCGGGADQIASAWPLDAQRGELARVASMSAYGRELAPQLERRFGEHREQWVAGARDACLVHRRGGQSEMMFDRRMACLDRSRAALAAVGELTRAATADTLPELAQAASAIPVPEACGDVNALADGVEPPAPAVAPQVAAIRRDLSRARVQIAAGRFDQARTIGDASIAAAAALHYEPLSAEANLVTGHALLQLDDQPAAIARLGEAMKLAFGNGMADVGIEAWARRLFITGTLADGNDALGGVDVLDALASRSQPFARALLANNIGVAELARNRRDAARDAFGRAMIAARDVRGPGAVELVNARTNMALVVDDPVARDHLFTGAHEELMRLLGADHPETLFVEWNRAMKTMTSSKEAAAYLAGVCQRHELHPSIAPRTAVCFVELAELREVEGDRDGARAAQDRAVAVGADKLEETPEAAVYRLLWSGDAAGAARAFEAARTLLPEQPEEPWFMKFTRAKLELGHARSLAAAGRTAEAVAALAPARVAFAVLAREQQAAAIQRRLAAAEQLSAALTSRGPANPTVPTGP